MTGGGAYGNYSNSTYKGFSFGGNLKSEKYLSFNDVSFQSNEATGVNSYGGAVFVLGQSIIDGFHDESMADVKFSGNMEFTDNRAGGYGGGYAAYGDNITSVFGTEGSTPFTVSFEGNSSGFDGGGIYAAGNENRLSFYSRLIFSSNTAARNGGAIFDYTDKELSFYSNATESSVLPYFSFVNNKAVSGSGGAIYSSAASYWKSIKFFDSAEFLGNTAYGNGGAIFKGGAGDIAFSSTTKNVSVLFKDNYALTGSGGAIWSGGSGISFAGPSAFTGNVAFMGGGAICKEGYGEISFGKSNLDITVFNGNISEAGSGGGIYSAGGDIYFAGLTDFFSNSAGGSGGAIFSGGGNINFWQYVQFSTNSSGGSGGAVYSMAGSGKEIMFDQGVRFFRNTATEGSGGALFAGGNAALSFKGGVSFEYNSAASGGGAVYSKSSNINFEGQGISFTGNKTTGVGGHGGALYKDNASGSITFAAGSGNVSFAGNSAAGSGGGIYSAGGRIDFYDGVSFYANSAKAGGGAIFSGAGNVTFHKSAEFISNSASGTFLQGSGGALHFNGNASNLISFAGISGFISNSASASGGAVYSVNAVLSFLEDVVFSTNTAGNGGGALFTKSGKVTFGKDAYFIDNKTAGESDLSSGGAVYAYNSEYKFNGSQLFSSNATNFVRGGAIYSNMSTFTFTDAINTSTETFTVFEKNTITGNNPFGGGAVYASESVLTFNAYKNCFTENKIIGDTSVSGGAIFTDSSIMNFKGETQFIGNAATAMGGALALLDGNTEFMSDVYFQKNRAADGGAVYMGGSASGKLEFNGNVVFGGNAEEDGNKASSNSLKGGGAVLIETSGGIHTLDFADNKTVSFVNNGAGTGGALSVYSGASNGINFKNGVVFGSNTARLDGGAIYSSIYGSDGSAVYDLKKAGVFYGNKAGISGGAVHASGNNSFKIGSYDFINNSASGTDLGGGAIYSLGGDFVFGVSGVVSVNNFKGNSAGARGGAISQSKGTFNFHNIQVFEKNSSGASGGAVFASSGAMTFNEAVTFTSNTSSGDMMASGGGALYLSDSQKVDFNKDATFLNNEASGAVNGSGGAVYSSSSVLVFGKTGISSLNTFHGNKAKLNGGAIYQAGGSGVFNSSAVFTANEAASGGAIHAEGKVSFGDTAVFMDNKAVGSINGSGGAVYNSKGELIFSKEAAFLNNQAAASGGAMKSSGGKTHFAETAVFSENKSLSGSGGALYLSDSEKVNFDKDLLFLNNGALGATAGSGGAVYSSSATLVFGKSGVSSLSRFADNRAQVKGGAIYQTGGSSIFHSSAAFEANNAGSGGAVYSEGNIAFNKIALFSANKAVNGISGSGGAVYHAKGDLTFSKAAYFTDNHAGADGGAVYMSGGETLFASASSFSGNKALSGNGGAFALNGKSKLVLNDAVISGNSAALNGGAFYVKGGAGADSKAEIYFKQINEDVLAFSGNMAGNKANAVHLAGNAYFEMDIAANKTFTMSDGFTGESSGNTFALKGAGQFNLTGNFDAYGSVDMDLKDITFNVKKGSSLNVASLSMGSGAVLNARNNDNDTIKVAGDFIGGADTRVKLEVFSDGTGDTLQIDGKALLAGEIDIKAGVGTYDNRWFTVISAENGFEGTQLTEDCSQVHPTDPRKLKYEFDYAKDGKTLMFVVNGIRKSNFSALAKSKNQKSIAQAIDTVSETATRARANIIDGIAENGTIAQQQDALTEQSPHFIANVINAQTQRNKRGIYSQVKDDNTDPSLNIWGYASADSINFKENENSIGDFNSNAYGFIFGADKYFETAGATLGAFGQCYSANMEQDSSEADVISGGAGIYGVWKQTNWEFKGTADFAIQSYETKRNIWLPVIGVSSTAAADFGGYSFGADVEAAYIYPLNEMLSFRPFAGFNAAMISYDGFSEKGAGLLNLDVESGSFFASNMRLGAGVSGKSDKLGFGAQLEYSYLLSGYEPEIDNKISGTNAGFSTVGAEIGRNLIGLNIAADYELNADWKVFAGGMYKFGEDFSNLYGNVGVRYSFK